MSFSRTFHPVGQGAFYTEQHYVDSSVLTVVYDCGSVTAKKEQFLRKVATALPRGTVIDLLFLSHFHADHVNGLDELLRCYSIRTVVLPKLTEEARILAKLENYVAYDSFSTPLLENPQAYFGAQTLIILVEAIGEQGAVTDRENSDEISIAVLPQADQPNEPVVPLSINAAEPGQSPVIPSGTPFRVGPAAAPFWEYIPYNYEYTSRRSKFLSLLAEVGLKLEELSTLRRVTSNKRRLTTAYRRLDGDLNENSLVVYSGPLNGNPTLLHKGRAHEHWPHFYYETHRAGCLYLGDADLSVASIVPDLRQRLTGRWPQIGTLQVPHHGAVRNFSPAIVDSDVQAVLSFGTTNPYGHPSAYVLGQLHHRQAIPVLVTEHLETALYSNTLP